MNLGIGSSEVSCCFEAIGGMLYSENRRETLGCKILGHRGPAIVDLKRLALSTANEEGERPFRGLLQEKSMGPFEICEATNLAW